jgi:hypothetical protein
MENFSKIIQRGIKNLSLEADVLICIRHFSGKMEIHPYYECEMSSEELEIVALQLCIISVDLTGAGAAEVWIEDLRINDAYQDLVIEASEGLE